MKTYITDEDSLSVLKNMHVTEEQIIGGEDMLVTITQGEAYVIIMMAMKLRSDLSIRGVPQFGEHVDYFIGAMLRRFKFDTDRIPENPQTVSLAVTAIMMSNIKHSVDKDEP